MNHMSVYLDQLMNARFDKLSIVHITNGIVMNVIGHGFVSKLSIDLNCYVLFGEIIAILVDYTNQMKIFECRIEEGTIHNS